MKDSFVIKVDCYAGHRAEERPLKFFFGERSIKIEDVIDRWLDPNHRYFKIKGDDKKIYIIRYDVKKDQWQLTLRAEENHFSS